MWSFQIFSEWKILYLIQAERLCQLQHHYHHNRLTKFLNPIYFGHQGKRKGLRILLSRHRYRPHLVRLKCWRSIPCWHLQRKASLNLRKMIVSMGTFLEPWFYQHMIMSIATESHQARGSQNSFCSTHSLENLNSAAISRFALSLILCRKWNHF